MEILYLQTRTPIVYFGTQDGLLDSERRALDLVGECGGAGTQRALIDGACLPPAFFDLKTGLAGAVLLKLSNYGIRCAVLLDPDALGDGRFYEFASETNRGQAFRFYKDKTPALEWLAG